MNLLFSLFDKITQIFNKKDATVTFQQNLLHLYNINFQPFCTKENSQTHTMEKGMIHLYAINSSELLRYP